MCFISKLFQALISILNDFLIILQYYQDNFKYYIGLFIMYISMLIYYFNKKRFFCLSWLYTEHRKDNALEKEQQVIAEKLKEKLEQENRLENGVSMQTKAVDITSIQQPVIGIINAGFESEKL